MSLVYHQIEPDNWLKQGVTQKPQLPPDVSFIKGSHIGEALPAPMVFEVDFPARVDVPHFIGDTIPVFSDFLVKTLIAAGVSNFQTFSAVLRSTVSGQEWEGFWAVNVVGLVRAAHLQKSDYDTLMEADPDGIDVPLLAFNELVLDRRKVDNLPMFRLAESPAVLLIHDRINTWIDDHPPDDGWGFDATVIQVA
ncbi:MAG: hypothetical protein ABI433_13340 [Burkholderiaceae bacterium]